MTDNQQPDFAERWVQQWKEAGPRLQAIRDEELRRKHRDGRSKAPRVAGHILYDRYPERHGLVVFQKWMMRHAMLTMRHLSDENQ
jgi:hypothetical protein